mmetsp:Transcript_40337/g.46284  ORF Transcript_40337/g.46284 Transcript_40337/m.46284 type:complete len:144 (+) Transcript_40337:531-962(+)
MLKFLLLPNDMAASYIEDVIAELEKKDPTNAKQFSFENMLDELEHYEIIQQLELNGYEKESVFNCQFFLRVLHEVGMVDLRKNNLAFNEEEFNRSRKAIRNDDEEDQDALIDRTVPVEENPEYHITDVNDLIYPLPVNYGKVF